MPKFIPEHTPNKLDPVVRGFLDCAEWLLDEEVDRDKINGWSEEAITQAKSDCADFESLIGDDAIEFMSAPRFNGESLGHDFFLTRNHHGAGFWDRGLGNLGERLTKAAHTFGSIDAYLGDDGFLYFM